MYPQKKGAKVIILNGPPNSGKDTLANSLLEAAPAVHHLKFAQPLRKLVKAAAGVKSDMYLDRYKDSPHSSILYMTLREYMIWMSEECYKPKFGQNVFGVLLCYSIMQLNDPDPIVVVSDGGFNAEIETVIKIFGPNNVMLVHLSREGCTFENDSRSYVTLEDITTIELSNDGELADAVTTLQHQIKAWMHDDHTT